MSDVTNFEERLLVELRSMIPAPVAEGGKPSPLWRKPRLALAGGLTAVLAMAAIAGLVFLSAGTQAAYAVTKNADGTVTVQVDSFSDAPGLEAALQAAGVNAVVQYLPEGKACQQPWFTPLGRSVGDVSTKAGVTNQDGGGASFTLGANIPAGATVVISTQTGSDGEQALGVGFAQGTVPPCQVVDASAGSGPLGGSSAGANSQTG